MNIKSTFTYGDIVDRIDTKPGSKKRLTFGVITDAIQIGDKLTMYIVDWGKHNMYLVNGPTNEFDYELVKSSVVRDVSELTRL